MLIKLINRDAEKALLSLLEQAGKQNITGGALYFNRSALKIRPSEEDFLRTIRLSIENKPSALYFFENGDVVITWKGAQTSTLADLRDRLYERYAPHTDEPLHAYFDLQAQGEELKRLCKLRAEEAPLAVRPSVPAAAAARPSASMAFPDEFNTLFRAALLEREGREAPEILVVEDQAFSRKMLTGMLAQTYKVHGAENATQAMEMYCAHAPDIVFLDIELPDMDGHQLAAAIRGLDPQAHIVMVTGNNAAEDVLRAKENGVKGFIVKPYNKMKIQDSIDKFMQKYPK